MEPHEQQQFLSRWEKQRAGGKTRYILRMAVLYTVVLLGVGLLVELFDGRAAEFLDRQILSWRLALYAVFGLGMGWFMWWLMERTYRRAKGGQ